jgi:hypothetical protein
MIPTFSHKNALGLPGAALSITMRFPAACGTTHLYPGGSMKRCLVALLFVSSIALVGCKSDKCEKCEEPKQMTMDACDHCDGVQTATADGKCPVCKMPAKTSK